MAGGANRRTRVNYEKQGEGDLGFVTGSLIWIEGEAVEDLDWAAMALALLGRVSALEARLAAAELALSEEIGLRSLLEESR